MPFVISQGRHGRPQNYDNTLTLTYPGVPQTENVHQRTLGIPPLDHGK
jgi:hypothetical protein